MSLTDKIVRNNYIHTYDIQDFIDELFLYLKDCECSRCGDRSDFLLIIDKVRSLAGGYFVDE